MDASGKALEIIASVAGRPVADLEPTQHVMVDLGIDSPKALQLIMDLEEAFAIEIDDTDAASLETVGQIVDCVLRLVA